MRVVWVRKEAGLCEQELENTEGHRQEQGEDGWDPGVAASNGSALPELMDVLGRSPNIFWVDHITFL